MTATLSPNAYGNGITLTPAAGSLTIPAAVGPVPGTATVNLTVTTTAEADLTQPHLHPGHFRRILADRLHRLHRHPYGPLYLSPSPSIWLRPGLTQPPPLHSITAARQPQPSRSHPADIPSVSFTVTPRSPSPPDNRQPPRRPPPPSHSPFARHVPGIPQLNCQQHRPRLADVTVSVSLTCIPDSLLDLHQAHHDPD